jgi:hypothetical protein
MAAFALALEGAACAAPDVDPEWWWPASPDPLPSDANWPQVKRALNACARCPVLDRCREAFKAQPRDEGGIWFGTTPTQRARAVQLARRGEAA